MGGRLGPQISVLVLPGPRAWQVLLDKAQWMRIRLTNKTTNARMRGCLTLAPRVGSQVGSSARMPLLFQSRNSRADLENARGGWHAVLHSIAGVPLATGVGGAVGSLHSAPVLLQSRHP